MRNKKTVDEVKDDLTDIMENIKLREKPQPLQPSNARIHDAMSSGRFSLRPRKLPLSSGLRLDEINRFFLHPKWSLAEKEKNVDNIDNEVSKNTFKK